jgi:hypothetical protein
MRGIPEFNFPAFHEAAKRLRDAGMEVFSPAERDQEAHGEDFGKGNLTGSEEEAIKSSGFSLREALADDLQWICREADAVALLPGWEKSKGACAEASTAKALGLIFIYL